MEETTSYPPIEPSNFDLIVIGTGLPESILASAASTAGKTVLHVDPNPFYGTHYSSLPLTDLISYLESQSKSRPSQNPSNDDSTPLLTRSLYSNVEISSYSDLPIEGSRKFSIDLSGPRVFLCADSMVDLMLKTGINQYMEFKSVDGSFVADGEGNLGGVPDSRSAIFQDKNLTFLEKNSLMKFFKMVQKHVSEEQKISEVDMESPFIEFLSKFGLSKKLKSIIIYAILQANYDQEKLQVSKDVINTRSALNYFALYNSSINRFSNANGAMIYPIYGHGELPQAFCRRAAVKGCIYVLRMPVVSVLMDEDTSTYKGVKLASGQELSSSRLILAPSFTIASRVTLDNSDDVGLGDAKVKVARGICIVNNSVKSEVSNCLVFFPPQSLYPEQVTSVRVLQLSSNVAVSPSGMYVTYFSAVCSTATEGKKLLNAAINALFCIPVLKNTEETSIEQPSIESDTNKPTLLWSALYLQELAVVEEKFDSINHTWMPDEHMDYNNLLSASETLFQEIYPGEEFFPPSSSSDENLDDDISETES